MKAPDVSVKAPAGNDLPVMLVKSTALRVLEATRRVEGMSRNAPPGRRYRRTASGTGGGGLYRLTARLNPATSTSLITSAGAVPQVLSGAALSDGSGSVTLLNYHDKPFASGSIVWAEAGTGGLWVIDVRSCANLT